jgi:DNA helicase HerA-like ATPase
VGVFFCTQLPTDVPNDVLSQLGARIQHALRAFTPDDQKALAKTVRTYPKTGVYDLESALTSLGIGEAIVTVLSEKGAPTPVAWTRMRAPRSLMDTIGPDAIAAAAKASPLQAEYGQTIDRESAYEKLNARLAPPAESAPLPPPVEQSGLPSAEGEVKSRDTAEPGMLEKMMDSPAFKSAMRSAGTVIGREITRSIFGTGRRRR